ncbi:MAG: hypothetical protein AB7O66_16930, partial [Limisphaerales bacterium]
MNPRVPLALSIAANVIFLAYLLRPIPPVPAPTAATPPTTRSAASPEAAPEPALAASPAVITQATGRKFNWEQVESADYRQYIQNLRSIGCPDETIRDIILADVNKLYEAKRKAIRTGTRKFEYWKPGNPMASMLGDPETLRQMRALEEEKLKVLTDLGIQPDSMNQMMAVTGGNSMDSMFDFLPESKRVEVARLMTEQQQKMAESMKDGAPDPSDIMRMQQATEDSLRATLTPEEFKDYQLRFSMTANMLRQQITGFDPSEEEFLKVFELKEAFDREYSPFGMSNETEAEQARRMEAQSKLNETLRETLGPERDADYERAPAYSYQQRHQSTRKAELPTP